MTIPADTFWVDVAVRTSAREYLAQLLASRRMVWVRLLIDGLIAVCALQLYRTGNVTIWLHGAYVALGLAAFASPGGRPIALRATLMTVVLGSIALWAPSMHMAMGADMRSHDAGEIAMMYVISLLFASFAGWRAHEHRQLEAARAEAEARSVEVAAAHQDAERQSRTDALTGVYTRRHLTEALAIERARASRDAQTPALLMVDVDGFKRINDTHGHGVGDAVLVEVARRLRDALRPYDSVARWGGDEFCVLAPNVPDATSLARLGEDLRGCISHAPIPAGRDHLLRVTVSVGAVTMAEETWAAEGVFDAVDRALYAAKRRGRDRVCLFRELTVEDLVAEEPEAIRIAEALALSASAREPGAERHTERVADMAGRLASQLGLDADTVLRCRLGGWLHDVGKVAIPDSILGKTGPLSDEDWRVIRTHPVTGENIVRRIAGLVAAAPAVRHHHEHVDGSGYPDGLAGDQIPLEARIVATADAFAAITDGRPYRASATTQQALEELRRGAGIQHDANVIDALSVLLERDQRHNRSDAESLL